MTGSSYYCLDWMFQRYWEVFMSLWNDSLLLLLAWRGNWPGKECKEKQSLQDDHASQERIVDAKCHLIVFSLLGLLESHHRKECSAAEQLVSMISYRNWKLATGNFLRRRADGHTPTVSNRYIYHHQNTRPYIQSTTQLRHDHLRVGTTISKNSKL
jgi:hypothetical protein